MNFAADHPRLVPLLAGLGISIAFSWTGRFLIHEALAIPASVDLPVQDQGNFLPPAFQEGSEIKHTDIPPLKEGQFMPFPERSESKECCEIPPLQEGEFVPPGVIPKKTVP